MARKILLGILASSCIASPSAAQRVENISSASAVAFEKCPLTPTSALAAERASTQEFLGPLLATIIAGFAGDLVKSGFNAVGDALDTASKEQGYIAEGTTAFNMGQINPASDTQRQAAFEPTERCIVLFSQSDAGKVEDMLADPALARNGDLAFEWKNDEGQKTTIVNSLKERGLSTLPSFYAELTILPGKEGLIVRPNLVWYRTALKGAPPKTKTAAEMHVTLATPAFDPKVPGIGTAFAGVRLNLPKLQPGDILGWNQLRGSSSVWLPLRPTTGFVDAKVQALNAAYALVATRTAEVEKAKKAVDTATRAQTKKPGTDADEALQTAKDNLKEAEAALKTATDQASDRASIPAGATNIQVRFVVVRDENKFGQAIAKALKSQAETAGKGVTEGLSPKPDKPEWATTDTTYLTAMIDVQGKQKAYDDAIAGGDAAAIVKAGNELKLSKAKANEAAVGANKTIPFPGLLADLS